MDVDVDDGDVDDDVDDNTNKGAECDREPLDHLDWEDWEEEEEDVGISFLPF